MNYCRRLPLTGEALNVRDLGGYAARDGRVTKFGRVLRSDNPAGYSDEDVRYLLDYGVRATIDLRSGYETDFSPHSLNGVSGVKNTSCPLDDIDVPSERGLPSGKTLGDFYIMSAMYSKSWIRMALAAVVESDGCVLINCTAGKDRTGIICASLLAAAGVSREDIVSDYMLSKIYLGPKLRQWILDEGMTIFNDVPPDAMEALLCYLDREYGGVCGYLVEAGVGPGMIAAITEKLTAD